MSKSLVDVKIWMGQFNKVLEHLMMERMGNFWIWKKPSSKIQAFKLQKIVNLKMSTFGGKKKVAFNLT